MTFAMAQVAQDQETVAPTANAPKDTVLGQVLGKEDAQDDLLSESDDEQTKIQPAVASSPEPRKLRTTSALMDFAASSSGKDLQLSGSFSNKMSSGSGTSALAQLAAAKQSQQHRSSSLVDVANSMNIEGSMNTNVKVSVDLQSIAKQIDEESKDQQIRKSQLISTALHDAKKQVVQEQRRHTNMVLREALDATVQEEEEIKRAANILQRKQAKQQVLSSDNQEDEQYDDDTGETPEQQNSIKKNKKAVKEKSVDHFVLKKRQGLTGHGGLKKTKPPLNRFNKDKLSKFQLDCLTLTQKRLLLAMLVNNNTVDNRNNQEDSKEKLQHMLDLSKAKHSLKTNKSKKTKDQIYAKLDDIRHCKFKPRIGRGSSESSSTKKNNNQDDDEEEDTSSSSKAEDFIRRMEATERARQQNLHRTREERIYLAQVDKKECPQCGNSQSYAEFQQKRQKCPNCGVKYQRRLAWGDIGATFFERLDFQEEQKLSWVENMTNKQAKEIQDMLNMRKIVFDKETHQLTEVVLTPPQWDDVAESFLGRVEMDLVHREKNLEALVEEAMEECPFQPVITKRAQRVEEDFETRMKRDIENRKQRQERYGFLRKNQTQQRVGKKRITAPKPFSLSFEERLQADLEKRRQRERQEKNKASGIIKPSYMMKISNQIK